MADKRDPRHEAGQQHIDHLMSRYSSARDAKKSGKEYDQADIENVRKAGLMTPKEIEKDFPKPGLMQRLKDNVMGTEEQNVRARKEMAEQDAKNPNTFQAKVNRMLKPEEKKKGGKISSYKSGGSVKSASARADGCAIRGKTRA